MKIVKLENRNGFYRPVFIRTSHLEFVEDAKLVSSKTPIHQVIQGDFFTAPLVQYQNEKRRTSQQESLLDEIGLVGCMSSFIWVLKGGGADSYRKHPVFSEKI